MRKFENINIIKSLRTIMEHNIEYCQSDFDNDIIALQNAAADSHISRHFLWLSRGCGTWCFPERDVYIRSTEAFNTWDRFTHPSENAKAFAVKITAKEDKNITGNIYELDYAAHIEEVHKNSFDARAVEITFKHPDEHNVYIRKFNADVYNNCWDVIVQEYGPIENIRYEVPDEWALKAVLWAAADTREANSTPGKLDEYIASIVKERFHRYGYTQDDMVFTTPRDAYDALEHKIPIYMLSKNNTRELVVCTDEISYHILHQGIFGMSRDMKDFLDYLVAAPGMKAPMFSDAEMRQILSLAVEAGKSNDLNRAELKIVDSLIYKLERLLPSRDMGAAEPEQQLEAGMEI